MYKFNHLIVKHMRLNIRTRKIYNNIYSLFICIYIIIYSLQQYLYFFSTESNN